MALITGSSGTIKFNDGDSSNYVTLAANATTSANVAYTLPAADGSSGHFLSTNASGALSWAAASGASIASGTYGGNGQATQAITGLSFSPVLVMISKRCNAASCNEVMAIAWKEAIENAGGSGTDRSGTWWAGYNSSVVPHWADDGVRSVDSNGFTVGDSSENYLTLNGSGNTYTYVAIG